MAYNGSGDYSLPAGQPVVTGTTISSTTHNNLANDIATAFDTAFCRDGQATATAAFDMGGFRIQNMGVATGVAHAVTAAQVQNNSLTLLSAVAGTNTITATATPTPAAYASGQQFCLAPANTNTGAATINVSSLGAKNIFSGGVSLRGGELVAAIPVVVEYDGTQFNLIASGAMPPMVSPGICQGRLTLTSGTPVTTGDVTAAETIYWTPFRGNKLALYTGATWKLYSFSEISGDVPDATQMNDVFVYDNAGTLTLDIVAWTNDTTRATALASQDGVLVKTGATGRRYVGSFYSTTAGNGQTEDSLAKRYVWNYYNRVVRQMQNATETTNSWTYSTATLRQANANTANQLDFVVGVSEDTVTAVLQSSAKHSNAAGTVRLVAGIGLDSTSVNSAQQFSAVFNLANDVPQQLQAFYGGYPGIGKHILVWLEYSGAVVTTTWMGDDNAATLCQSGISGELLG